MIDLYKIKIIQYQSEHIIVSEIVNFLAYVPFIGFSLIYIFEPEVIKKLQINLRILTKAEKEFSDKISPEKMCTVTVSENIFDEKINVKKIYKNSENNFYLVFLSKIEEIKRKKIDDIEKLKLIDKKIKEYKKEIIPENSIDRMIDFSFVLNIISEYLSNYERSLETKSLDLLKIMDSIRRKLDYYLLEFRYKFVENDSPILNIKIDRCKILCDSIEMKSIYLEKGEAKKFLKNL